MKSLIFALTFLGTLSAQAASSYSCTLEEQPGVEILMTPVNGVMKVFNGEESQDCEIEESPEALSEVNAGFKENLNLDFDAEVIVTCGAEVADGVIIYLVGKSPLNGMSLNSVISSPVVGPLALSNCTKK